MTNRKIMKKIAFATLALAVTVVSVPLFSAFEAHVINVTARIENALAVTPTPIMYGTVFPEEVLHQPLTVVLSTSFQDETRVDDVNYVIRQKPKCGLPVIPTTDPVTYSAFAPVSDGPNDTYVCPAGYVELPLLCPFLSKHPDATPANDGSIDSFHGPITGWTQQTSIDNQVLGRLAKSEQDISDTWDIDLTVPCFKGACAQDHVVPSTYQLNPSQEHNVFGCDLWIEATGIEEEETPVCVPTTEVLDGVDNDCNGIIDETLLFSEYIEGSSNNKALEIYNPTGGSIDLSGYKIDKYVNGSASATNLAVLPSVSLATGDVYVVCDDDAGPAILAQCDFPASAVFYNGNDAMALKDSTNNILDVIGQIGFDPGTEWGSGLTSTADNTIVRNCGITHGDTNGSDVFDPATEWNGFVVDTFGNLGSHDPVCP